MNKNIFNKRTNETEIQQKKNTKFENRNKKKTDGMMLKYKCKWRRCVVHIYNFYIYTYFFSVAFLDCAAASSYSTRAPFGNDNSYSPLSTSHFSSRSKILDFFLFRAAILIISTQMCIISFLKNAFFRWYFFIFEAKRFFSIRYIPFLAFCVNVCVWICMCVETNERRKKVLFKSISQTYESAHVH